MGHIQYLVDQFGHKTAVVIPLKDNETAVAEFLEDLYGHAKILERVNEETVSKEELLEGLTSDGLI